METILAAPSITLMAFFFIAVVGVKAFNANPKSIFVFSIILLGITIFHVATSGTTDALAKLLSDHKKFPEQEIEAAKHAVTVWNFIVPFLVGGLGVNMFNTWLTTPHKEHFQNNESSTSLRSENEILNKEISKLKSEISAFENCLSSREATITSMNQQLNGIRNQLPAHKWKRRVIK